MVDLAVEQERRRAADRDAVRERRAPGERRRPPVAQFTWEDTVRIIQMVAEPPEGVACPRCEGWLLLGPPDITEGVTTREVHCTACRYSVAIVE